MSAGPVPAVFDENGNYVVSGEAAAHLSAQLGHQPIPGEQVTLALVGEYEPEPRYDDDFQHWLQTVGKTAYGNAEAHPERSLAVEQVKANLAERHARRLAAQRTSATSRHGD